MRKTFQAYYTPTQQEFAQLWQEGIFAFDANLLLNSYRYSAPTREKLFEILKRLGDRIWLPYQAALEYQRNRLDVIAEQFGVLEPTVSHLQHALEGLRSREGAEHPFIDTGPLRQSIHHAIEQALDLKSQAQEKYDALLRQDSLREQITELFDGKVGACFPPERVTAICQEGAQRFKQRIPPGYKDRWKKEARSKEEEKDRTGEEAGLEQVRRYGDLLLWYQLIEYAASQKKPIIFVSDDGKEDWWLEHKGATLGPRPELREEMTVKAGVPFYMYSGLEFIKHAQTFLGIQVQQAVLDEVRTIKQQVEEVTAKRLRLRKALTDPEQKQLKALVSKVQEQEAALEQFKLDEPMFLDGRSLIDESAFPEWLKGLGDT